MDWIQADVDGDGVTEFVPRSDRPGPAPPQQAYLLLTGDQPAAPQPNPADQRFYLGGNIYSNWATVPDVYKSIDGAQPNPSRSTASIFSFRF